jgi:hypothetical protein
VEGIGVPASLNQPGQSAQEFTHPQAGAVKISDTLQENRPSENAAGKDEPHHEVAPLLHKIDHGRALIREVAGVGKASVRGSVYGVTPYFWRTLLHQKRDFTSHAVEPLAHAHRRKRDTPGKLDVESFILVYPYRAYSGSPARVATITAFRKPSRNDGILAGLQDCPADSSARPGGVDEKRPDSRRIESRVE